MKRFLTLSLAVFTLVCLVFAAQRPAFAYVDPGSGFIALQSLASILAAAGFFLRRHIRAIFSRKDAASQSMPLVIQKGNQHSAK